METQLIYQGLHNVSAYSVYKGRCCHSKAVGLSVGVFYPVYPTSPTLLHTLLHTMPAAWRSSPPPNSTAEPKSVCSLRAVQGSPPGSKKRGWQGGNLDFLFFCCWFDGWLVMACDGLLARL